MTTNSTTKAVIKNVSFQQKTILGFGFIAIFFSAQGIAVLAIPYYQMTLGVDPFLLSLAIKIPALIACCFGPYIGQLSDRCRSSLGRRRPFLFIFPWLSCITFGCIWMVPSDWSTHDQLIYFAFFTLCFYLISTCWNVPLKCLAYEASQQYHERTEIMAFITYFMKSSAFFYHWIFPLAKLSIFGGVVVGIQYIGWGIAIVCFGLFAMLPAFFFKERKIEEEKIHQKTPLLESIRSVCKIRNMRILLFLIIVQLTLGAFSASMDYYLLVYYMNDGNIGEGAQWKGMLSTSYAISGIIAVAIITKVSAKVGKRVTLCYIYLLTIIGGLAKWFFYQPDSGLLLLFDSVLCSSIWVGLGVLIPSMIADLIDEDEIKSNVRREGMFVAVKYWAVQIALAIAVISSGYTLNLIGFDASLGADQPEHTILLMRIILVAGTTIAACIGFYVVRLYDLDEAKHQYIKSKLAN